MPSLHEHNTTPVPPVPTHSRTPHHHRTATEHLTHHPHLCHPLTTPGCTNTANTGAHTGAFRNSKLRGHRCLPHHPHNHYHHSLQHHSLHLQYHSLHHPANRPPARQHTTTPQITHMSELHKISASQNQTAKPNSP